MNFNLSNAGAGPVKVNPDWNQGNSVLEVNANNFILSNQLWNVLELEDNGICTLYFNEAGVFLANITNVEGVKDMADKDLLKVSQVKTTKDLKNARSTRRKELLSLWTKNGNELGEFTIDEKFVKPEDVLFPLVRLTPYIVAEMESEIAHENHVSASGRLEDNGGGFEPDENENEEEVTYNNNETL